MGKFIKNLLVFGYFKMYRYGQNYTFIEPNFLFKKKINNKIKHLSIRPNVWFVNLFTLFCFIWFYIFDIKLLSFIWINIIIITILIIIVIKYFLMIKRKLSACLTYEFKFYITLIFVLKHIILLSNFLININIFLFIFDVDLYSFINYNLIYYIFLIINYFFNSINYILKKYMFITYTCYHFLFFTYFLIFIYYFINKDENIIINEILYYFNRCWKYYMQLNFFEINGDDENKF